MQGVRTKIAFYAKDTIRLFCRSMTKKTNVNGVDIAYEKVGSGPKAVLLMPGVLGSGRTDFGPQMDGLCKERFTVIACDPRGYGKSIPPSRDFPLDFYYRDAEDAATLMENLGFLKYSILGWSDGGNSAAIVAGKHPEKVETLVLLGSTSYITKEEMEVYEKGRDISSWSEKMRKPMIDLYGEEYFRKTWNDWVDGCLRIFHEKNGDVCSQELEKITAPTLIIHGMKDAHVPVFHPQHFHSKIKGSVLDCWEEGKHNLHLKYSNRFNAEVEEFILREH